MVASSHRGGSMHGQEFALETIYAGIDEANLYARLDFADAQIPEGVTAATLHFALRKNGDPDICFQLETKISRRVLTGWQLNRDGAGTPLASGTLPSGCEVALGKVLTLKIPMELLGAQEGDSFNLRFVLYRELLPLDALPEEGSLEIQVAPEVVLLEMAYESM